MADRRLDFTFTGGQLKTLKATGGTVTVTDLGAPVETMTIDMPISGPLQDALEVLDTKPFRYAHEIGLDPAHIGGKVEAQLHFKLPLVNDLKFDQVDYAAKATLTGASIAKVALDRNLSDANFTVDLARIGVHVQGSAKFDGSPTTVDGNIYFHPAANGPRTRCRIGLSLDDAARQRLGWDRWRQANRADQGRSDLYRAAGRDQGDARRHARSEWRSHPALRCRLGEAATGSGHREAVDRVR